MEITVFVREIHIQEVLVEANNNIDAMTKVEQGEGKEIGNAYYYETLDSDTWTAFALEKDKQVDDTVKQFWDKWWDSTQLEQLELLETLPICGDKWPKTTASYLNSYLADLKEYSKLRSHDNI